MLDTVFMEILDMTKTASIVILFVVLARLILKRAPKIFSYVLWAVVLFRLICPVSVELPVSAVPELDSVSDSYSLHNEDISVVGASQAAYQAVGDVLNGGIDIQDVPTNRIDEAGNTEYVKAYWWEVWVLFGQYVWAAGILAMAVYSIVSYIKLRKRLIGAVLLKENIYLSDNIDSPFVMGLFRPKIYLPSVLSKDEQEYIILHEKHHIKRLDHIFKAVSFVALCIHWFNPLVWLSFVLSGKDMEMSCDEAVIKKMGADIRADYSASLLSLATGKRIVAGTPLAFGEGDTKGRIRNLAKWKKPAVWIIIIALIVSTVTAVFLVADPVDKTNGGKNYISVYEIEEGSFSEMEEMLSTSNMLKVRKGEKEYFNATPLGGGSSNVIGFLESLSLGSTQEREFNFAEVDGCITVLGDTHNGVEIYFAKDYSRLWLRSLADSSYSSVYVVLNVEQARNFFENREYLNDVAIWEFDSLSSADGHRKLYFYLDNEYELAESTNVIESEEHGLKGISWSPNNASVSSYLEESSTIYAVRNGEKVELTVTMTKVGENEHGGVYFRISADEDTVLSGYGNGYEYVLGKVESDNSEDDTYGSDVLNGEVSENHISENVISGSNLDAAVSEAILSINSKYSWLGECPAEGHIIMGTDKEGDKTKAYVLEAYSSYGFDNGWFIELGGHSTACVMTFLETDNGYVFQGVEYTEDGAHLKDSVKRLFPLRYRKRAISFNEEDRQSLTEQCRKYAAAYLEEKGRTEKIGSYGDVERISLTDLGISVEASNRILEQKGNISYCHIGYYEELQDGVRYLCRTGYSETENIVVYIKERYDTGQIAEVTVFDSLTGEIITDEQPDNMEYFYGKVLSVDKNEKYALVEPIENSKLSNTVEKVYVSLDFDSKVKTPDLYDGLYIMVLYKGKAPDSDSKSITMDGTSAIYLYADMNYKGNPALKNNKQEHTTKAVAA